MPIIRQMALSVAPKLLYVDPSKGYVPVWELKYEDRNSVYYERFHIEGMSPCGYNCGRQYISNKKGVTVIDTVIGFNKQEKPEIMRASDGYEARKTWYRPL